MEDPTNPEVMLSDKVMSFFNDPLGFVLWAYPWGETDTELFEQQPEDWQIEVLTAIRDDLAKGVDVEQLILRYAVAAGYGTGKSALIAWIIQWFLSTRPHPQAVITAGTQTQLTTKTWRELAKWQALAINGHWFEWTATQFKLLDDPNKWYATAIPWSKHKPDAFAGTHEKYVLIIFDESSTIDDIIWDTVDGAETGNSRLVLRISFGNAIRNTGRFRQCWTKFREQWRCWNVDSRKVRISNKTLIAEWIKLYGEDSDYVRVHVKGEFPRAASTQFISSELVENAVKRDIKLKAIQRGTPRLMGVDVARQGDDKSVVILRSGRKMLPDVYKYRIPDLMKLASHVAKLINDWQPDTVFVDATGMGAGVYDRLVQLGYTNIVEVHAGQKAMDEEVYYNVRIEMWDRMKAWLPTADIPEDRELMEDLIGPEFSFDAKMRMQLERKEDMRKRGIPSPDVAEALALTFAQPVPTRRDDNEAALLEPDEP